MSNGPLLQEALDLTYDIVDVGFEINRDDVLKEEWTLVAFLYLIQSRKYLLALHHIVREFGVEMMPPAKVLVRALFERRVRLQYMNGHPDTVTDFVKHHSGNESPHRPWRNLAALCKDLGLQDHYDTVYRITSEEAHGGVRGMPQEFRRLLDYEQIADWDQATPVATGLADYLSIININVLVFPDLASNFDSFQTGSDWHKRFKALFNDMHESSSRDTRQP